MKDKLLKVMEQCGHISRDSYNSEVKYPYVSAAKVNDAVNRALLEVGIATTAESELVDIREVAGQILATVAVKITLTDGNETFTIKGIGSGLDIGDKSVAKAQTMAVKYAWKNSLLIVDSSDEPDATKIPF